MNDRIRTRPGGAAASEHSGSPTWLRRRQPGEREPEYVIPMWLRVPVTEQAKWPVVVLSQEEFLREFSRPTEQVESPRRLKDLK